MTRTTSDAARRGSAVLAMSGITVDFGPHVALRDVSLEVYAGQVVGVIGPNGAGKTTLLDVACGAVAPTAGRLAWHGKEVARLRPKQAAKLGVSRTVQQLKLDERSPVLVNVMAGAELPDRRGSLSGILGAPRSRQQPPEVQDRAHAALNDLGIAAYADECPAGLPTAVRKRVALARALVRQPELLLLDELAGGLSPAERSQLGKAIRRLTRRTSVVLVEHHMDVVMHVCDHVLVLDSGQVIAQGPPGEVRADPAVVAAYLGDEPQG